MSESGPQEVTIPIHTCQQRLKEHMLFCRDIHRSRKTFRCMFILFSSSGRIRHVSPVSSISWSHSFGPPVMESILVWVAKHLAPKHGYY